MFQILRYHWDQRGKAIARIYIHQATDTVDVKRGGSRRTGDRHGLV